jgi:hypothetical protein
MLKIKYQHLPFRSLHKWSKVPNRTHKQSNFYSCTKQKAQNGYRQSSYHIYLYIYTYKKVKESRNRPGVAQRVPGGLRSQISWHSAREGGNVVSLTHRPPLPPGMFLVVIFTRGSVDPRAMVRSEGICHWKIQWDQRESIPGPSD